MLKFLLQHNIIIQDSNINLIYNPTNLILKYLINLKILIKFLIILVDVEKTFVDINEFFLNPGPNFEIDAAETEFKLKSTGGG